MPAQTSGPRAGARSPGLAAGVRVVVAHDYLTQRGGAERVALAMLRAFPGARLVTSCYQPDATYAEFAEHQVETSPLNRLAVLRRDPRRALPLLARTFQQMEVVDADVVLCSSSGWSHGISTRLPKVVYCHNPPRWLHQRQSYLHDKGLAASAGLRLVEGPLRRWDRRAALDADVYLANSTVVAGRVLTAYGRQARVLHPPRGLEPDGPREPIPGLEPGYLLTVGRPRGYKHTDLVAEAVEGLPEHRLVCVGGRPHGSWSDRVTGLTDLTDAQLRWVYANCRALVACSEEDFGLTPVEVFAFGRPAALLRQGGYLDTAVRGLTGTWIEGRTPEAIRQAVRELDEAGVDADAIRRHAEQWSPESFARALRAEVAKLLAA